MTNVLVLLNAGTESIKRSESTQKKCSCLVVASGCIYIFFSSGRGDELIHYIKARAKCGCVHVVLHTSNTVSHEYVLPVMCL